MTYGSDYDDSLSFDDDADDDGDQFRYINYISRLCVQHLRHTQNLIATRYADLRDLKQNKCPRTMDTIHSNGPMGESSALRWFAIAMSEHVLLSLKSKNHSSLS